MEINIDGKQITITNKGEFIYNNLKIYKTVKSDLEGIPDYIKEIDTIKDRIDVVDAIISGDIFDHIMNNTFYYFYDTICCIITYNRDYFTNSEDYIQYIEITTVLEYRIKGPTKTLVVHEIYDMMLGRYRIVLDDKSVYYKSCFGHEPYITTYCTTPICNEIVGKHLIGNSVKSALH